MPLHEHQIKAQPLMKDMEKKGRGGFLADEMGLGKTITMAHFLMENHIKGRSDLIVAPVSLLKHWRREIKVVHKMAGKPRPSILIYHGPKRTGKLDLYYDYVITTYSLMANGELGRERWGRAVLDESHYIKNGIKKKGLKAAIGAYEIGRHSCYNWCISGTPFNNRLMDIASQAKFVGTWPYNTKEWWKSASGGKKPENVAAWREKFVLRRTKDGLMDPPTYHDIEVEPAKRERALFDILRDNAAEEYRQWQMATGDKKRRLQSYLLALIVRLRVCANSFYCGEHVIDVSDVMKHCAKVSAIIDELDQQLVADPTKSVVVFSQFTSFLDILEECADEVLVGVEIYRFTGSMSIQERDDVIKAFGASESPRVLLISLMAGGVGLTLTSSATVFLCEPYFNPFVEKQAEERVHRLGQKHPVNVFRFFMRASVETWMNGLKESKFKLANDIGLLNEDDSKQVETFSFADLGDLFKEMVSFRRDDSKPSKKPIEGA